jgi:hypothetical protein
MDLRIYFTVLMVMRRYNTCLYSSLMVSVVSTLERNEKYILQYSIPQKVSDVNSKLSYFLAYLKNQLNITSKGSKLMKKENTPSIRLKQLSKVLVLSMKQ